MDNVDFSGLRKSPRASLDPITSALESLVARKHAREQQEERIKVQREQEERLRARDASIIDRNNAAQDLKERQFVGERTAKNFSNREQLEDKIRGDIASGNYGRAEQRGANYAEADAKTGDVTRGLKGFKVDRGGPRPSMPESPVEYGPREAPPESASPMSQPMSPEALQRSPVEQGPQMSIADANRAGEIRGEQQLFEEPFRYREGREEDHASDVKMANVTDTQGERHRFNAQQNAAPPEPEPMGAPPPAAPMPDDRAAERERFAAQNTAPRDVEMATYQQQLAKYGRRQPDMPVTGEGMDAEGKVGPAQIASTSRERPDITLGGVPVDQDELRYSAGRADAEDFGKIGNVLQASLAQAVETRNPQAQAAAQRKLELFAELSPAVETGRLPAKDAANRIFGATTAEYKREGDMEQTVLKGQDAKERAGILAESQAGRAATAAKVRADAKLADKAGGDDPKTYARIQADTETFDRRHNISTDRKEESRMATLMQNKDVTIVQRAIAGNLARGIGAERGVLTDKDITRLQGNLGGYWQSVENWLSKGYSGELDEDVKAKLVEGIQVVLAEKAKERKAAEKAYVAKFFNPSYPGQKWGYDDHLRGDFEEKFGHPYEPTQQVASAPSRGGARPDPSNPDDANDPKANRPLDGDTPDPNTMTREQKIKYLRNKGMLK